MGITVWQRAMGMAVNMHTDGPALRDFAQHLKANKITAHCIQAHQGTDLKYTTAELNTYLDVFRSEGFKVGIWGYLDARSPEDIADVANNLVLATKSMFYIGNAEIEYKYTDGNFQHCPECFGRSQKFVKRFRSHRPTMHLGVSSYGRFDQADIHWAAWLNDGNARALPQAYANEQGMGWTPLNAFKGAIDVKQPHNVMYHPKTKKVIPGFPNSYVHVAMAKPDMNDAFPLNMNDWINMLIAARNGGHPYGFGLYEVENYTAADITKLGTAIVNNKLALY